MSQRNRWILIALLVIAVVVGLLVRGWKKRQAETARGPGAAVVLGENLVRIHWLGKEGISAETNSGTFTQIWNLPDSLAVQSRFLDQLSVAPWRLLPGNTNYAVTSAAGALLRPLLDDLVQKECYLQVTRLSNEAPELALAIKLDEARARLWKTNLEAVWSSLAPGLTNEDKNWPHGKLEVRRSGQWTLAGIGREGNPLLGSLEGVVRVNAHPPGGSGRLWLEGDVALAKIVSTPAWLTMGIPDVELAINGNPQGVSSKAILNFPRNLPFEVEPWNVPTNLIHGPINGFTAVQGFGSLLASNQVLKALLGEASPNQLFTWSQTPHPSYVFAAIPSDQASNAVPRIADFLVGMGNPWLATNGSGQFERTDTGVFCTAGTPMMGPFMDAVHDAPGDYILAGFARNNLTNQLAPAWMLGDLASQTNVVLYEREITGGRVPSWLFLGQALRIIFWKAQLSPDSLEAKWFTNTPPRLGNLLTVVAKTGPNQLTLNRSSSMGLNAIELHLMADWIESANFPRGIHTTVAKGMVRPGSLRKTNAPPPSVTETNR